MRSHYFFWDCVERDAYDGDEARGYLTTFPPNDVAEGVEFVFGLTAGIMINVVSILSKGFVVIGNEFRLFFSILFGEGPTGVSVHALRVYRGTKGSAY